MNQRNIERFLAETLAEKLNPFYGGKPTPQEEVQISIIMMICTDFLLQSCMKLDFDPLRFISQVAFNRDAMLELRGEFREVIASSSDQVFNALFQDVLNLLQQHITARFDHCVN